MTERVLVWFSCGVPSACAAKLAVEKYGFGSKVARVELHVVNCDLSEDEHPDNARFLRDVEQWIGWPVERIRSAKFSTVDEVNEKTRYMSGPAGARCTTELKKKVRWAYQRPSDLHIWGYTTDEPRPNRVRDFVRNNPDLRNEFILRDAGMTTRDCHAMIVAAKIESPAMYWLGYRNNNCRGCVKSTSPGYWNKVRRDFPEVFRLRAERSRALGVKLVELHGLRVFLDELPTNAGRYIQEDLSCGPACNAEAREAARPANPFPTPARSVSAAATKAQGDAGGGDAFNQAAHPGASAFPAPQSGACSR